MWKCSSIRWLFFSFLLPFNCLKKPKHCHICVYLDFHGQWYSLSLFVQLTIKWRQQNLSVSLRLCNICVQSDVCLGYIRTHERVFFFCLGGVCVRERERVRHCWSDSEALLVSSSTVQGKFSHTLFFKHQPLKWL